MRTLTLGLGLLSLATLASVGCARAPESHNKVTRAALTGGTVLVPWGAEGLAFEPGGDESRARGPQALTFSRHGDSYLVLDGLASRVVEIGGDGSMRVHVQEAPRDADGMALSKQGELAFHRAVAQQIDVFDGRGRFSGSVPVPPSAHEATTVHLLSQGRVMLEHPYQERYLLGSPNVPRQPELVVASAREGIADDFREVGYQVSVGRDDEPAVTELGRAPVFDGNVVLREMHPTEVDQGSLKYKSVAVMDLGKAASARIFGVVGTNLCAVLEHVDPEATVIDVKREVVCVDAAGHRELARFKIETSKLYTPRQELVFDGRRVGQALPTEQGLALRTVEVSK